MATSYIVAIGLVVLNAFATAVLWFEFRSRERRSIERIDQATQAILGAINALRGDLAPVLGGGPSGGAPLPPDARPTTPHNKPVVVGLSRPFQPSPEQIASARSVRAGAVSDGSLPVDTRTAEAFRKAHPSSPTLVSEGIERPPPSSSAPRMVPLVEAAQLDAATIARVDALAADLGMTREEILVRAVEIGTTDPEALAATLCALGKPANDEATARRETLTPTDPSTPAMDARVERRWHEKIAAAQEAGQHVQHCHGECCVLGACECRCDRCIRIKGLLAEARREVLGK
jgi:hypothetical protein